MEQLGSQWMDFHNFDIWGGFFSKIFRVHSWYSQPCVKPNIHHHAHYCLPLLPVLGNMNSVHIPIPCFFEIYLKIIPSGLLPSDFLTIFFFFFCISCGYKMDQYVQGTIVFLVLCQELNYAFVTEKLFYTLSLHVVWCWISDRAYAMLLIFYVLYRNIFSTFLSPSFH